MKAGVRALGIAESFQETRSTVCGAVVTPRGRVDGFSFASCTVGGLDATEAVIELWEQAGREDIQYCLLSGVALAWFNLVDLERLASAIPVPVLALTYEESEGLADAIAEAFSDKAAERRLTRYRSLPARRPVTVSDGTIYVRCVDEETVAVADIVQEFTETGLRPEPVRVARLAARAADDWQRADRSG